VVFFRSFDTKIIRIFLPVIFFKLWLIDGNYDNEIIRCDDEQINMTVCSADASPNFCREGKCARNFFWHEKLRTFIYFRPHFICRNNPILYSAGALITRPIILLLIKTNCSMIIHPMYHKYDSAFDLCRNVMLCVFNFPHLAHIFLFLSFYFRS
jgi:hypothetical protein